MAALAMSNHLGKETDDAVDDAAEIYAKHPIPIRVACVFDRQISVNSGIVAQHMHLAEGSLCLRRRSGHH